LRLDDPYPADLPFWNNGRYEPRMMFEQALRSHYKRRSDVRFCDWPQGKQ